LQLFLKDIGRVDLLTAAQEVELAKRIERGDHRAEAGDGRGEPAPGRLDREALPHPVGCRSIDLIQEGTIGLVRAAEKFDPPKGLQVLDPCDLVDSTAVARALDDKGRTIRMPVHVVEKLNRILRAERKLRTDYGREPTSAEIARELEMSIEEVDHIRRTSQTPVSLEKPVGDDDESEFGHFLEDDSEPLTDEVASLSLRNEALTRALSMLGERERKVLELAVRPQRRVALHPRRGGADVQRHARADPPDREPLAEEAPRLRRRR